MREILLKIVMWLPRLAVRAATLDLVRERMAIENESLRQDVAAKRLANADSAVSLHKRLGR